MKQCTYCKLEKALDEFYPRPSQKLPNRTRSRCKECERVLKLSKYSKEKRSQYYLENKDESLRQSKEFYAQNKTQVLEYGREYYHTLRSLSLERDIIHRVKSRAKKKEIEFNLSVDDIVIPDKCPVLGITLIRESTGRTGPRWESPSIDRGSD